MTIGRKFRNETGTSRTRVEYVFGINHEHKCEKATFLGGNVTTVENGQSKKELIEQLIEEMDSPIILRAGLLGKGPGMCHTHYSVSLALGETLTLPEWRNVSREVMEALGYDENHKWFAKRHEDKENDHIHLLGNRISMDDGKMLEEGNDYKFMMKALRKIETKHKLSITKMPNDTWGVHLRDDEVGRIMKQATPEIHWKHMLIARIAGAIKETNDKSGDMVDFVKSLKKKEVKVEFTIKEGKIIGISYEFKGNKISGRKLKRQRCTFNTLIVNEGIRYDQNLIPGLQKIARIRDEKSGRRDAEAKHLGTRKTIDERIKYELSYEASIKSTGYKSRNGYFAIVVQADKYRRSMITSRMTPSRIIGNNFFFSFQKPTRDQISWERYGRLIASITASTFSMMQETLTGIKCEIESEIEFIASAEDGPRYKIIVESPPRNSQQYSMKLPIEL
jgi:hypothetical protein